MTSTIPKIKKTVSANKNATTTIVLELPVIHHAIFPIGYDLAATTLTELTAVTSEQKNIEAFTETLSDRSVKNASLQPGWLMVFREGVLWKEFEVRATDNSETSNSETHQTTLHEVDLLDQQTLDHREAEGEATHYFLLPEDNECEIAFSDVQWPWLLISHMGGLLEEAHPDEADWPYLLPENYVCRVGDDPRLHQWSNSSATQSRKQRCQKITKNSNSCHQQRTEITLTQKESDCIPSILQESPFDISADLTNNLAHFTNQHITVNVLNADHITKRLTSRYHAAWALLTDALTHISTPYEKDHPLKSEFPYSNYYESALIAHQVYFSEPNKQYSTLWERDNLALHHRKNLKLNDIQLTLGVDLRKSIRGLIEIAGNDIADFLNGEYGDFGKDWLSNLTGQLNDTWAFSEAPSDLQEDENDPTQKQFRHIRWQKLSTLFTKLADHPASQCQHIDGTPTIRKEVASSKEQQPGYRVLNKILQGKHPLSPLALNQPDKVQYTYQQTLEELIESMDDGNNAEPDLMKTLLTQIHQLQNPKDSNNGHATKDTQEATLSKGGQAILDVSLLTTKWALSVASQLLVGSNALSAKGVDGAALNGDIEQIRKLLGSAPNVHLHYSSFNDLIKEQSNTSTDNTGSANKNGQLIIAKALSDMQSDKTEISDTDTPKAPEEQAKQLQVGTDKKLALLEKQYLQDSNQYKRIEAPKAIDEQIKAINAAKNANRKALAESNNIISDAIDKNTARLREILLEGGQEALDNAYLDSEIKDIENIKQQAIQKKTQAIEYQKYADERIDDFKQLKVDLETSRIKKTSALTDQSTLLANIDKEHPLYAFKKVTDDYLNNVKQIQGDTEQQKVNYRSRHQQNQLDRLNKQQQGIDVIHTNTAEGRSLKAFLETQRNKLKEITDNPIKIEYTTAENFSDARTAFQHDPKVVVFTPAQSTTMNAVQKGSYIVVGEESQHIFRKSNALTLESRQEGTVMVGSLMLILNTYNTLKLLNNWKGEDNKLKNVRNVVDLLGTVTGTGHSIGEVWKSVHEAKKLSSTPVSARAIAFNSSKLLNVRMLKTLPIASAVAGIAVGSYDAVQAFMRGDDVGYTHAMLAASGISGLLAIATTGIASAILGPIGIALAIGAVILQHTLLKEDNMLDTWLEKGPFSEDKNNNSLFFRPIPITGYQLPNEVSDTLKQKMGVSHHSVWFGGESIGRKHKPDPKNIHERILSLSIKQLGIALVLDQNYVLLGYKKQRSYYSSENVIFNDLTGDISVLENSTKHTLGRIGETLGANSWGIIDTLIDSVPSLTQEDKNSDVSVRFEDVVFNDEDKFTEPMKLYPAASLELLLNGLYPLKASFELMPVEKKLIKILPGQMRKKIYEKSGNRAKITIDLPYFIEGESVLMVEIRVAREDEKQNNKELPSITFKGESRLKISQIDLLDLYENQKNEGYYKNIKEGKQQLVIIKDFTKSSFNGKMEIINQLHLGERIELECWVILAISHQEGNSKNTVQMPYKKAEFWLSPSPSVEAKQNAWLTVISQDTLRS